MIISSLIQLPTLTPPQLVPPPLFNKLRARSPLAMLSRRNRGFDIGKALPWVMLPLRAPYDSFMGTAMPAPAARSWLVRFDFGC